MNETRIATQTAITTLGTVTRFMCLYKTARLAYTVTLVTNPHGPKKTPSPLARPYSTSATHLPPDEKKGLDRHERSKAHSLRTASNRSAISEGQRKRHARNRENS